MNKYHIALLLSVILTPYFMAIECENRGKFVIGGECFIPVLLLIICLIIDAVKEAYEEVRKCN